MSGKLLIEWFEDDYWHLDAEYPANNLSEALAALEDDLEKTASPSFADMVVGEWVLAAGNPVTVDDNGTLIRFSFIEKAE